MIDERTSEQASLYVLDLLDDRERTGFEARMAASAELRARVGELTDALHEPLRRGGAEARPDLLDGIHRRIGLAGDKGASRASRWRAVSPWSVIWAVAAVLMLALNLSLLMVMARRDAVQPDNAMAAAPAARQSPAAPDGAANGSAPLAGASREELVARISRLEQQVRDQQVELTAREAARKTLAAQKEEAIDGIEKWEREYMRLAARFLPFFESKEGFSRFTVIEMVDSSTFDNKLPRRGFADLAGQFLSGEGNIAGTGGGEFVGPVAATASDAAADVNAPVSLAAVARGAAAAMPAEQAATAAEAPVEQPASAGAPAGFTVWRDDEQKGFLDLYNLPEAGAGRDAFLWVRSSEMEPYVPVGYLPALENGTGSLFYSVDQPGFTPVEILITAEDTAQPGEKPSEQVLLRGP